MKKSKVAQYTVRSTYNEKLFLNIDGCFVDSDVYEPYYLENYYLAQKWSDECNERMGSIVTFVNKDF